MNIAKNNLNHLIALHALLTERNVTRAGEKIFITQSAMSNVLKQLREVFQDELLVMKGRNMQLTLRASELYPKVQQILSQAEHIFMPEAFNPATCHRKFILGMEEYTNFVLLPRLYAYLSQHAPNVEIEVKHVPFFEDNIMLESHKIDLAIGLFQPSEESKHLHHDLLFKERLVCIGRKKHPLFKKRLTLKRYLEAHHVSLTINQKKPSMSIDHILHESGHQRRIVLRLPHIVPGLYTIAGSDLIATVPEGVANEAARLLDISIQPCPFTIPPISFLQAWHPSTNSDSGYCWLRKVVKEVAQNHKQF